MKKLVFMLILMIAVFGVLDYTARIDVLANVMGVSNIGAQSYIVIDNNGKVLVEKNSEDKKPVASICKLMTTLLTLEKIESGELSLEDKFVASSYACSAEGSQAFLDAGSEYFVKDLLKSVIVASANDSAIVLAESLSGSEYGFVEKMNNRARELGMKNTLYANSTGLTDNNTQYSTAKDTSIILNKISEFQVYKDYCSIWIDRLVHPSGRETELVNTNRLIKYLPYCISGKTGFTDEAKYCLASSAEKNNLKLTCVVLGCDTASERFTDSIGLYNYAYAHFKNNNIISSGENTGKIMHVSQGVQDSVELLFDKDFSVTTKIGEVVDYRIDFKLPNSINAPIGVGEVVGSADIYVGEDLVGNIEIISSAEIKKHNFNDIINKVLNKFALFD